MEVWRQRNQLLGKNTRGWKPHPLSTQLITQLLQEEKRNWGGQNCTWREGYLWCDLHTPRSSACYGAKGRKRAVLGVAWQQLYVNFFFFSIEEKCEKGETVLNSCLFFFFSDECNERTRGKKGEKVVLKKQQFWEKNKSCYSKHKKKITKHRYIWSFGR